MPLNRWTLRFENFVTSKYLVVKILNHLTPFMPHIDDIYMEKDYLDNGVRFG